MLDISTNQTTNIGCNGNSMASGAAGGLLDDDIMDPLFDEDWLHEHNLDILFDLFEEEIESKVVDTNNGSSSIFGTSPVTSYLFGTSPSLASALDYYADLLYFDNQQPTINYSTQQTTNTTPTQSSNNATNINPITTTPTTATTSTIGASSSTINSTTTIINNNNNFSTNQSNKTNNTYNAISLNNCSNNTNKQQVSRKNLTTTTTTTAANNHLANPITNAMRIKRGLKKGQSEGISLLARPLTTSSSAKTIANAGGSANNKLNTSRSSGSVSNILNKGNSDKTSAKITNFKKIIMGSNNNNRPSGAVDIINSEKSHRHNINNYTKSNNSNRDRHIHHYHNHVHYITGCSVIREHAYAVPGH